MDRRRAFFRNLDERTYDQESYLQVTEELHTSWADDTLSLSVWASRSTPLYDHDDSGVRYINANRYTDWLWFWIS